MIISEAIKQAYKEHKSIMLRRKDGAIIRLLPTDTRSKVIESANNGEFLVSWEPTYSDLVSDEWEISYEFRIKPKPSYAAGPAGEPAAPYDVTFNEDVHLDNGTFNRYEQLKEEWNEVGNDRYLRFRGSELI